MQAPTSESILVYNNLLNLFALIVQKVLQLHLGGVIGVRAENHAAILPIKWEVRHLGEWKLISGKTLDDGL